MVSVRQWRGDIVARAPGKLILTGEHAVVYGHLGVAAAVERFVTATLSTTQHGALSESTSNGVRVKVDGLDLDHFAPDELFAAHLDSGRSDEDLYLALLQACAPLQGISAAVVALTHFALLSHWRQLPLKLVTITYQFSHSTGNISLSGGMGSSAALAVSLSAVLALFLGTIPVPCTAPVSGIKLCAESIQVINEAAWRLENLSHGRCSGIDNTVSCLGGLVRFGDNCAPSVVPFRHPLRLLYIDSGVKRDTKTAVSRVRQLREERSELVGELFSTIQSCSEELLALLNTPADVPEVGAGDVHTSCCPVCVQLQEALRRNQAALFQLGISHRKIDEAVSLCAASGLSAKLSGGGLGGAVISLLPCRYDVVPLLGRLETAGFTAFPVAISQNGVLVDLLS